MLSRRIPTILPNLTFNEALEITKIHSIAGILPNNEALVTKRPFRAPHHLASAVSIAGGGRIPKPGEMSLAHFGVLFFDELPEFDRRTLEVMRGPLEDKKITIARMNSTLTYPCNFMFVASMNPCPCGYYGDTRGKCTCSPVQISNYMKKVSGPMLDRIDIHIEVPSVEYEKLQDTRKSETSEEIRKRVNNAKKIQSERYKNLGIISNSELNGGMLDEFCKLEKDSREMLKKAFENLGLSARAHARILKVARTIADLDGAENIELKHIAEAIMYRSLDRKFWR